MAGMPKYLLTRDCMTKITNPRQNLITNIYIISDPAPAYALCVCLVWAI